MIYQLDYDSDKYKSLYISALQLVRIMKDKNKSPSDYSLQSNWADVKGSLAQKKPGAADDIPDITFWNKNPVLSPMAYDVLRETLIAYGELLPVNINGATWYVFNILEFGDSFIEQSASKQKTEDGDARGVESLSFIEGQLPLVFKTEFDKRHRVFCNEEFKRLVEQNELSGLVFSADLVKYMHA